MRVITFVIVVALICLLAGCWDIKELEDLIFIDAIGIDRDPGGEGPTLTIEHLIPVEGGGGGGGGAIGGGGGGPTTPQAVVHKASGETLTKTLDQLRTMLPGELFFGYVRVIIVGEEAAKKDMAQIMEFIDRSHRLRRSSILLITPGKASDILAITDPHKLPVGEVLGKLVDETVYNGFAFPIRVGEVAEALAISGIEPVITRVVAIEFPDKPGGQSDQSGGTSEGHQPGSGKDGTIAQKPGEHKVSGMAVFKGFEPLGWLNETETRGWGWITNHIFRGHSVVLTPRSGPGLNNPLTFYYSGGKTSTEVSIDNDNKVTVHLKVKAWGEVFEWVSKQDLVEPSVIKDLEADLAANVKSEVEAALAKAQELGSDIFGFGFELSRQHRREWDDRFKDEWTQLFPEIPVKVTVEAIVNNTGITVRPLREK